MLMSRINFLWVELPDLFGFENAKKSSNNTDLVLRSHADIISTADANRLFYLQTRWTSMNEWVSHFAKPHQTGRGSPWTNPAPAASGKLATEPGACDVCLQEASSVGILTKKTPRKKQTNVRSVITNERHKSGPFFRLLLASDDAGSATATAAYRDLTILETCSLNFLTFCFE